MAITVATTNYLRRLVGAAMLDASTYEEVEAEPAATGQAFATVVLSGLAAGLGARGVEGSVATVLFVASLAILSWSLWAVISFEIGARLMRRVETRSDVGELLRTLGFATAPGFVLVLGLAPEMRFPVFAMTAVWLLAAMTVAVRQALDFESTWPAVAVCALGWILVIGIALSAGLMFGPSLG
jgi:hypothetical protein